MSVRSRCRGEPVLPDSGDSHAVTSPLSSAPQMTNSCGLQFGASLFIFSSPTCAAHVAARRSDLCPDLFPFLRGTGNSIALRAKTYIYARGWCRGSTLLCTGKKNKTKNLLWDLQQRTSGLLGLRTLSCTALSPLSPLQGALMLAAIPVLLPRASLPMSPCPPASLPPRLSANLSFVIDFL